VPDWAKGGGGGGLAGEGLVRAPPNDLVQMTYSPSSRLPGVHAQVAVRVYAKQPLSVVENVRRDLIEPRERSTIAGSADPARE